MVIVALVHTDESKLEFLHCQSVAGVVVEFFIHLGNFFPVVVFEVTTLCLHEVVNHAPIGVSLHNELGETCESRVKHCVVVHESMVGYRFGVWGPEGSVPQLVSVTIHEVSECFLILCLSLKGTGTDSTRELTLASGSIGQVTTLGEDLLSVRVGGFVHAPNMAHPARPRSSCGYKTGDSLIIRAYGSPPIDIPPLIRIHIGKNIILRIRSGSRAKYKTTTHE